MARKGTCVVSAGERASADATTRVRGSVCFAAGDVALFRATETLLVDRLAAGRTRSRMTLRLTEVSSAGKTLQTGKVAARTGRFQMLHAATNGLFCLPARTRHRDDSRTWWTPPRVTPLAAGVTTGQDSPAEIPAGMRRKPGVELWILLLPAVAKVPVGNRCEFLQTVLAKQMRDASDSCTMSSCGKRTMQIAYS